MLVGLSSTTRTRGGVLTRPLTGDRDLPRALPGRRVRGLGHRAQHAALVERDGEGGLRVGEHRMQIDARDLRAVLVERDVADEMLEIGRASCRERGKSLGRRAAAYGRDGAQSA